jgi:ribose-phosphate pyrophosphokinase
MKNKFTVYSRSSVITPEIGKFPGGEIRVKINEPVYEEARIEAMLLNSDDVMTLVMLTDALRELEVEKIRLTMPYIPYARQDRVCNPGEALSIRAFADIINSLNFASVVVFDPHSEVSSALIKRSIVTPRSQLMRQHEAVYNWICKGGWDTNPIYLVSPDAGSVKKSYEIAKVFPQFTGIIFAEKVRDVSSGNIVKTIVHNVPADINKAKLLICDDICDGGRTFIELANWFSDNHYTPQEINLYVTHGIFSKGTDVLLKDPDEDTSDPSWTGRGPKTGKLNHVWSTVNFLEYKNDK